ncbi:MAG: AAA family ATPase [Christensenellales bacterium]|jgi:chromosome segregation ATPase
MKITKIKIRNLFGIKETELDGRNVEVTGTNGTGKTSVIDAIRLALTNDSERDYVIKQGENEGEVLIETDTGLYINRKKRTGKADYKSIKDGGKDVQGPEAMLKTLFTPLQIDPVAFIQMDKKEQNRLILDLIEFDWDLDWIIEQFGELPRDVNYEQNILQVLNDIQSEDGYYYKTRQDINRDLRNKRAFVEEIAETIPSGYDAEKWESYDLGDTYRRIEQAKVLNGRIERAKIFKDSYDNKVRGYEAEKEIAISAEKDKIASERDELTSLIERSKAEIKAAEDKLKGLDGKLEDKVALAESQYKEKIAKLDSDVKTADEYIDKKPVDTTADEEEVKTAEAMKKHLNEYRRMKSLEEDCDLLKAESEELTGKIELARNLPGQILEEATLPVEGLTVEDGVPLINGLPVSNLSEGEKLKLCVDVALSKPNNLQIILIDGAERLSDENREKLYKKCKDKGLQFIATKTTNDSEMEVRYL